MKKAILLTVLILSVFIMPACSLLPHAKSSPEPTATSTPAPSQAPQNTTTAQPTIEPTKTSEPTPTILPTAEPTKTIEPTATIVPTQASANISNDLLSKNAEALDSYRRKTKTITTMEGQKSEKKEECAYIKKPFSSYMLLDFVTSGSYNEEIIANDTMWNRMSKNGKWDKALPGNWFADPPRTFKYDINTQMYPINYGKLTLQQEGNEQVNGINCIKYTASGTYQDEFTFKMSTQIFPITLSATGTIWISNDPSIKQIIISQRITVKTDIVNKELKDSQGNPTHVLSEDVIEDDMLDINSVKITPPPDSETNTPGTGN